MSKKLKRVVVKEELVALTGDFRSAILLNQLIYWSERTADADYFVKEEKKRLEKYSRDVEGFENADKFLTHGWIYKTAEDLSEECMMGLSKTTILRDLQVLLDNGWLDERRNPIYKWDRTKQYRVNIVKIQQDLNKLGYCLEGYSLDMPISNGSEEKPKNDSTKNQNESCKLQNETSTFQDENLKPQVDILKPQDETTIPETTTKTTIDTTIEKGKERDINNKYDSVYDKILSSPSITDGDNKDLNSEQDREIKKAIIPEEYINHFSRATAKRFENEREFYGIDFNKGQYYNIFANAVLGAEEKDDVDIISKDQYGLFLKILRDEINK